MTKSAGKPKPRRAAKRSQKARRGEVVQRLLEGLDHGLTQLEARMTPDGNSKEPPSAADAERNSRTLSGLARLYAKLVALDGEKKREGGKAAKTEAGDDADKLRHDLALRLQRLNQTRDP
jgi:hypothetical protein